MECWVIAIQNLKFLSVTQKYSVSFENIKSLAKNLLNIQYVNIECLTGFLLDNASGFILMLKNIGWITVLCCSVSVSVINYARCINVNWLAYALAGMCLTLDPINYTTTTVKDKNVLAVVILIGMSIYKYLCWFIKVVICDSCKTLRTCLTIQFK